MKPFDSFSVEISSFFSSFILIDLLLFYEFGITYIENLSILINYIFQVMRYITKTDFIFD